MSSFIKDKRGISEEFTSLPTLVVVMIGFALFFALIGGVYFSYNAKVESVDKYETANFILEKVTAANSPLSEQGVIRAGGAIDVQQVDAQVKEELKTGCAFPGWEYKIEIEWNEGSKEIPVFTHHGGDTVAASKKVPVYLNEAQTVAGEFRVIVWEA